MLPKGYHNYLLDSAEQILLIYVTKQLLLQQERKKTTSKIKILKMLHKELLLDMKRKI
jgi:hypothetical protein